MVEDDLGSEQFMGRMVEQRGDMPFRIALEPVVDEIHNPPVLGKEGFQPVKKGRCSRMNGIEPAEALKGDGKCWEIGLDVVKNAGDLFVCPGLVADQAL